MYNHLYYSKLIVAFLPRPHAHTHSQRPLDRVCAVHAAQLYLLLLQLPGSGAFKIFHSMIFQRMLDVFHLFSDEGEKIPDQQVCELLADDPLPTLYVYLLHCAHGYTFSSLVCIFTYSR